MDYDIVFFKPKDFNDSEKYVEHIKNNRYVHINFSQVDETEKRRILDFIDGALFVQEGDIKILSEDIMCTIPKFGKYLLTYEVEKEKRMSSFDEEEEIVRKY